MVTNQGLIISGLIVAVGLVVGGYFLSPAREVEACANQVRVLMDDSPREQVAGAIVEYCHMEKK